MYMYSSSSKWDGDANNMALQLSEGMDASGLSACSFDKKNTDWFYIWWFS